MFPPRQTHATSPDHRATFHCFGPKTPKKTILGRRFSKVFSGKVLGSSTRFLSAPSLHHFQEKVQFFPAKKLFSSHYERPLNKEKEASLLTFRRNFLADKEQRLNPVLPHRGSVGEVSLVAQGLAFHHLELEVLGDDFF